MNAKSVIIVPEARHDLESAIAWYDLQLPGLGEQFRSEVANAVRRIVAYPRMAVEMHPGFFRVQLRRFPYGVMHSFPDEQRVLILCIAHLHRHPDVWRSRT